jgi:hypothetical protein
MNQEQREGKRFKEQRTHEKLASYSKSGFIKRRGDEERA